MILVVVVLFIFLILFSLLFLRNETNGIYLKDKSIHPNEPKYYISIVSVFRNEEDTLESWLTHHISEGIDHFYMINDNSTDGSLDILSPYINKGIVTLYDVPTNVHFNIFGTIEDYSLEYILPQAKEETEWLILLKIEDFLSTRSSETFQTSLKRISGGYNQIYIGKLSFGSGNYIEDIIIHKDPTITYVNRQTSSEIEFISIYRPKTLIKSNIVIGKILDLTSIAKNLDLGEVPPLIVNSYPLQSKGYWYKVKKNKVDSWLFPNNDFIVKNLTYNKVMDSNLFDKKKLSRQSIEKDLTIPVTR